MNGSFSFPEWEKSTLNRPIDYRTEYFVFYNGERPCMLATNLSPFNRKNE
jgi:nitrous oxide reductase accessory protein NosL